MGKVFDRINHKELLHTLKTYDFSKPIPSWFASFLLGRTQIVKYQQYLSEQINVTSGILQLDHLSFILFCLLINDFSSVISYSKMLLIAYDAKIYKHVHCIDDAFKLQTD